MDPIYAPAFDSQISDLLNKSPDQQVYLRIAGLIEKADYGTTPQGMLRTDGRLFLMLNMGAMIVIPWQRTQNRDFFSQYPSELQDDLIDILTEAKILAAQLNVKEISANLLVMVTATRRSGQRTRGINIWGP
jgi:hypothetical protein